MQPECNVERIFLISSIKLLNKHGWKQLCMWPCVCRGVHVLFMTALAHRWESIYVCVCEINCSVRRSHLELLSHRACWKGGCEIIWWVGGAREHLEVHVREGELRPNQELVTDSLQGRRLAWIGSLITVHLKSTSRKTRGNSNRGQPALRLAVVWLSPRPPPPPSPIGMLDLGTAVTNPVCVCVFVRVHVCFCLCV